MNDNLIEIQKQENILRQLITAEQETLKNLSDIRDYIKQVEFDIKSLKRKENSL
jgi:hypothetical protein